MTATTFVDRETVVTAAWLNGVDQYVNGIDAEIVNVRDFGAVADGGATNDSIGIQAAIAYSRTRFNANGNQYFPPIYFPPGAYYIGTPIDCTNMEGLWLYGDAGRYLSTWFIGNTSGVCFDFTGSSHAGAENLGIISFSAYGATRSNIGFQFGLSTGVPTIGGLNCQLINCFTRFDDDITANAGYGSIGVLNIQAEEFVMSRCNITANVPCLFSSKTDCSSGGAPFTATSNYIGINTTGSMGVITIDGSTSLYSKEKRHPALIAINPNTLSFTGYMSRNAPTLGTNDIAIKLIQSAANININATIESYSTLFKMTGSMANINADIVCANMIAPISPYIVNMTDCIVSDLDFDLVFPTAADANGRYLLWDDAGNGADNPLSASVTNSIINCKAISDNFYAAIRPLMKRCNNVIFNTGQPFTKSGGTVKQFFNNEVTQNDSLVTSLTNAIVSVPVVRFRQFDRATTTSFDGGMVSVEITGICLVGNYGSGQLASRRFTITMSYVQQNDGTAGGALQTPVFTTTLLEQCSHDLAFANITAITPSVSFGGGIGIISVLPTITGTTTGIGEAITFFTESDIRSYSFVNESNITA